MPDRVDLVIALAKLRKLVAAVSADGSPAWNQGWNSALARVEREGKTKRYHVHRWVWKGRHGRCACGEGILKSAHGGRWRTR
jgi:hypothetical protein